MNEDGATLWDTAILDLGLFRTIGFGGKLSDFSFRNSLSSLRKLRSVRFRNVWMRSMSFDVDRSGSALSVSARLASRQLARFRFQAARMIWLKRVFSMGDLGFSSV